MRNATWLLIALLVAQGAAAEDERERWDDSHMRSRHQATPPSNRPRLEGTTGYAQLLSGGAETRTQVSTELEFTSQRQWIQGPLAGSAPATTGVSQGSALPSRGSSLRSSAVHSR